MFNINSPIDSPGKFYISGEMTIYEAEQIKQDLMQIASTDGDIEIDLSNVTEIDTTGIQQLIALKKEANRRSKNMILSKHSDSVTDIIRLFNLGSSLGETVSLEWS